MRFIAPDAAVDREAGEPPRCRIDAADRLNE